MNSLVASLLQSRADKPIPLTASEFIPHDLPADLISTPAEELFPHARDAKGALAGLLLIAGHWDLSHQVSQDVPSREGSYWHAIAHRVEPDTSNAGYWFRKVGPHPIFSELYLDAKNLLGLKNGWDPQLFLKWCDEARQLPNGKKAQIALQIQRLECDRLFSWCALKTNDL